jgi:hypothetical protein
MLITVPDSGQEITQTQAGVISRRQALAFGMSQDAISWRLRTGRWRALRPGIYSVTTGVLSREAMLWAAVLFGGSGAALSYQTAAELHGLTKERNSLIHITIPEPRRIKTGPGLVVHRSSRLAQAVHPSLLPPRIRVEETVLDLASQARTFEAAFDVVCAPCQRRLTTSAHLADALAKRRKMRWRAELTEALNQVGAGVHSLLEYRYLHWVEKPHRLPAAARQVKIVCDDRNRYLDNLYRDYGVCVELDGRQAHPDDRRWQDLRRVNAFTARGIATLRYGWTDINDRPCLTAAQIAMILRSRGWPGDVRRCAPGCAVPTRMASPSR